ncbi:MAG: hypothetical protein ACR2RV_20615 [Verrucomicrobiales bacterium]
MEHSFDVRVSQRDADIALRRFILRSAGWGTLVAAALCIAFIVYDVSDGGIGPLGIGILTLLSIFALVYAVGFFTRRKQMADLLRRLGDSPVSYSLGDAELAAESALGSSSLKWEMVRELWVDPDITLVFYARNGYTTIPTPQIPADALTFLAMQVERAGGAVKDNRTKAPAGVDPSA